MYALLGEDAVFSFEDGEREGGREGGRGGREMKGLEKGGRLGTMNVTNKRTLTTGGATAVCRAAKGRAPASLSGHQPDLIVDSCSLQNTRT